MVALSGTRGKAHPTQRVVISGLGRVHAGSSLNSLSCLPPPRLLERFPFQDCRRREASLIHSLCIVHHHLTRLASDRVSNGGELLTRIGVEELTTL